MDLLDGIRVIDVTQVWAGPVAGMHLGNLGAEVVKVERPGEGEVARSTAPFVDGLSTYWGSLNTDKRSVTIDLSTDDGRGIFLELAETADVIVENNKPGTMEKFGVGYDDIRERNPEVVYCSIRGFGEGTVYEDHPSFDVAVQAMSGAMSITGEADGPPIHCRVPMGDISAATFAVESILASLFAREHGGGGRYIEVPMMNSMMNWLGARMTASLVRDEPYPRTGNRHTDYAPYGEFETADSHIVVAAATQDLWERLCDAIDREDLLEDPRFSDNAARVEHREALYPELDRTFGERTTEAWFDELADAGVPAAPVYDTLEVWDDPYPDQQDLLDHLGSDDLDGSIPVVRYPANVEGQPVETEPPRRLGADTDAYLEALGYSAEEIEDLRERGVI